MPWRAKNPKTCQHCHQPYVHHQLEPETLPRVLSQGGWEGIDPLQVLRDDSG